MNETRDTTISIVMPAYNAEKLLPQVLPPLLALKERGEVAEVLVVDDRSPDNTAGTASQMGAEVLTTPMNGGPGAARNLAAQQAIGDVLWFIDSDVVAQEDGAARVKAAFADPAVGAVFGSYDMNPGAPGWFSNYKNLVHHYHHQKAKADAKTFWAGCGAVRKDVFLELGGFDIETYKVPSIEDIELGYRISGAGYRIALDPGLLCRHLKVWSVANSVKTDIFKRALPWSRLMIGREGMTDDLNTGQAERIRALIAWFLVLSLFAMPFTPGIWPAVVAFALLAVLANFDLVAFFARTGGAGFAALSLIYHQFYYVYASATFAWCLFEYHVLRRRAPIPIADRAAR